MAVIKNFSMPAPKNNDYNKKWKSQNERQAAFKAVCDHIASGLSKASLPIADWDTVEAYMEQYPKDFPADRLREAMRCQMLVWEKIGLNGVTGEIKGFNATAWAFNMKNRFPRDWRDKIDHGVEHSGDIVITIGKPE
jgi:hypothetical protein